MNILCVDLFYVCLYMCLVKLCVSMWIKCMCVCISMSLVCVRVREVLSLSYIYVYIYSLAWSGLVAFLMCLVVCFSSDSTNPRWAL
jgi:hypothetical protein